MSVKTQIMRINPQLAAVCWINTVSVCETVRVQSSSIFKPGSAGITVDEVLYSAATVTHIDEQSLSLLLP